ncbi:MAG TPA: FliH/SctL family protein [Verrucomicrobiae bacterium]|jgi:flagellar biosynthesis/type III secretory pathway protein FliH|nr:FliH/SctL family protein [Verrucomicrobiae bacterium]
MKPWSDTLLFPKPLREIRPRNADAIPSAVAIAPARASEEELQASYERGRNDAEKALREELLQQRAEVQELVAGALKSMRESVPQIVRDTETSLVALALSIAQKMVVELPITTEMMEAVVRDALTQIEGTAEFTVRLHPADLELLQKSGSPLIDAKDDSKEFRFVSSSDVTRGGCLVQTRFGTVDARRETKLDLLQRSLLE